MDGEAYLIRFYKNDKSTGVTIGLHNRLGDVLSLLFQWENIRCI